MPRPHLGNVRVSLTVRKDVLEASREYIPNLPQFLENRLLEFLKWVNHPLASTSNTQVTGRRGFEPPTPGLRVPCSAWLSYRPSTLKAHYPVYQFFGDALLRQASRMLQGAFGAAERRTNSICRIDMEIEGSPKIYNIAA